MATLNEQDRDNLVAYLDGELDEEASREIEAKLSLDGRFRAEADALKQAWGLLDYLPDPETPPDFTNRTLERLSVPRVKTSTLVRRHKSRWFVVMGWAAAMLLAVGSGLALARWIWLPVQEAPSVRSQMVQHFGVVKDLRLYENVEDMEFLEALDHPELFGEEKGI